MFRPEAATWANPDTGGYGWGQLIHMLGGLFYITDLCAPRRVRMRRPVGTRRRSL